MGKETLVTDAQRKETQKHVAKCLASGWGQTKNFRPLINAAFPSHITNHNLSLPHSTIPACPIPSPCLFLSIAVVVFSRQVMSNSSRPRGLQHVRPPCPPPSPRIVLAIVLGTNQHTIYVIYAFTIFLPILECTRCVRRGTH